MLKMKYPYLDISYLDDEDVEETTDFASATGGVRTGEASNPRPTAWKEFY